MKFVFECTQIILNRDHAAVNGNLTTAATGPIPTYSITFAGAIDEVITTFRPGDRYPVEFGKAMEAPAPAPGEQKS